MTETTAPPKTYIHTEGRGLFGSALEPREVANALELLGPMDWYDIGNGTLIRVGAILSLSLAWS